MIAPWLLYASALGTAMVLIALLLERLARWQDRPLRWIWVGALLLIVALPITLNFVLPAPAPAMVRSAPPPAVSDARGATVVHRAKRSQLNLNGLVVAVWLIASGMIVARVVGAAVALRHRRKTWVSANLNGRDVLLAEELGPAVIGWTNPETVVPRWAFTLDEAARELMLLHESEHVRSRDPQLRAVAIAALVLMPWNPAIWWAIRRLRLAVEIDCDQRLIAAGIDKRAYASLLLAVGQRRAATPFAWATAFAGTRSSLEHRIIAMTSTFRPRHPRLALSGIAAAAVTIIAIACASPVPEPVLSSSSATALHRAETPGSASGLGVDTSLRDCSSNGTACKWTVRRPFILKYRAADSVDVNDNKLIADSIEIRFACDSDCGDFAGAGHRTDTAFLYRPKNRSQFSSEATANSTAGGLKLRSVTTGRRGYAVTSSGREEEPSIAYPNTTPKCTADQLQARLHPPAAKAGPHCEP